MIFEPPPLADSLFAETNIFVFVPELQRNDLVLFLGNILYSQHMLSLTLEEILRYRVFLYQNHQFLFDSEEIHISVWSLIVPLQCFEDWTCHDGQARFCWNS